jgi:hypothetical protein
VCLSRPEPRRRQVLSSHTPFRDVESRHTQALAPDAMYQVADSRSTLYLATTNW